MAGVKFITKVFKDETRRIFVMAIMASLLFHVFWLCAVRIVSKPDDDGRLKFSKVSFLGPLLNTSSMELQSRPKERSFLEKRYFDAAKRIPIVFIPNADIYTDRYEPANDAYHLRDERITAAIDEALIGEKLGLSSDE